MIKKYFNFRTAKKLLVFGLVQWLVTPSCSSFLFWMYLSHLVGFDPLKIRYVYFAGVIWTLYIFRRKIGQFLECMLDQLLTFVYFTVMYGIHFTHKSKNKSHEDPLDKNSKQDS